MTFYLNTLETKIWLNSGLLISTKPLFLEGMKDLNSAIFLKLDKTLIFEFSEKLNNYQSSSARYSIDLKEIFLYKFLHYLNIGPEVHFLYNEFYAV